MIVTGARCYKEQRKKQIAYARSQSKRYKTKYIVREIIKGNGKGWFTADLSDPRQPHMYWRPYPDKGPAKQVARIVAVYKNGKKIK